jgi:hypothetical protein
MAETLLTTSSIKLFGRVMTDLSFNYSQYTVIIGGNNLLQRQLNTASQPIIITGATVANNSQIVQVAAPLTTSGLEPNMNITSTPTNIFATPPTILSVDSVQQFTVSTPAQSNNNDVTISSYWQVNLARIYGFSFEGAYYGLPKPSIFLVHGAGTPTGNWGYPSTMEGSGVAAREWDFSGPTGFNPGGPTPPPLPRNMMDLSYWEYEKGDFSIRFDTEAGPFEQILLQMALRTGADMADRATPRSGSGLDTRSGSGLDTRSGSGLDTRSGSGLRR